MTERAATADMPAFRRHVRARILRELELSAGATRSELMRSLVLSRTALTRVLEPMFAAREIVEDDPDKSATRVRGRPARMLRLRTPPRTTLAVHIGHDSLVAAHVDELGDIQDSVASPTGVKHGFGACLVAIASASEDLAVRSEFSIDRCIVILPTMVDPTGTAVMPVAAQELMPTWIGRAQRDRIARAVGAPTWFENDGRLGALGEARFGNGKEAHTMLYVAVGGHGIGGGLLIGRELHKGAGFAGEISHVNVRASGELCPCGRRGCLAAEVRAATQRLTDLRDSARERDHGARAELAHDIVRDIGNSVAGIANVTHPDTIVIADRLPEGLIDDLVAAVRAVVRERSHPEIASAMNIVDATAPDNAVRAAGILDPSRSG